MAVKIQKNVTFGSIVLLTIVSLTLIFMSTVTMVCSIVFIPLKARLFERPPAALSFLLDKSSPFHDILASRWLIVCLVLFGVSALWLHMSIGLLRRRQWSRGYARFLAFVCMVFTGGLSLGWFAGMANNTRIALEYGIISSTSFVLLAVFFSMFHFKCIYQQLEPETTPIQESKPKCVAIYELS